MKKENNPMQSVKRCGAKTRAGHPCGRYAMANGRCRLHGGVVGKNHGRPVTTGLWTKEAIAQRKTVRALVEELKKSIDIIG